MFPVSETDPAVRTCRCKRPVIRMDLVALSKHTPLILCAYCDMGRPDAGPPVLLTYLRKGHM